MQPIIHAYSGMLTWPLCFFGCASARSSIHFRAIT